MRVAVLLGIFLSLVEVKAQSAIKIYEDLKKLNFLGSVLYLAAHPDDENTALISYFANQVHAETAYLSLTRGDGGQNRIGTELGELLGVIRTNELLAARKIDGGQQFFSSAIDFGYSKHPKETFRIWNHKKLLGEVIARFELFNQTLSFIDSTTEHQALPMVIILHRHNWVSKLLNYPLILIAILIS